MWIPFNAASAWTRLGVQWLEMMAASGQVIAHRTRRTPTASQWMRMGTEKMEAGIAAGNAMARHVAAFPVMDPLAASAAWARILTSGMRPYHSRARRNARSLRRRV